MFEKGVTVQYPHSNMLRKIVPVLIEDYSEKDGKMLMGYTDTMKLVNVQGDPSDIGKIINVKITDTKTWSMDGIAQNSTK